MAAITMTVGRALGSLLAGAMLALAFPGTNLDFLVWFSLIPLLFLLEHEGSLREGFLLGLLAGLGFFGVLLRWVLTLRAWIGPTIVPLYLLLICYQALYWGLFGLGFRLLQRLPLKPRPMGPLIPAALWVVLEFARASGPLGLPWGGLGYALGHRMVLIQPAEITGVWGLSFAILLVNYLLAVALRRRDWRPVLVAGLVILALWGAGQALLQRSFISHGEARLALVQPDVPQRLKTDPANLALLQVKYKRLLDKLRSREADLVILPESILPTYLLRDERALEPFRKFAQETGSYLLFGTLDYRGGRFYNTAALLTSAGTLAGCYDKVRLVPFSTEYVPGRALWRRLGLQLLLNKLAPAALTPGRGFRPLEADLAGRPLNLGTPICFESSFPGVARAFVRRGAELIITITNDAWFDYSAELPQHFSFGVLRAVETRRYFVQVANSGISGVITPRGRIVARSRPEHREIIYSTVKLLDKKTFYVRYGDWFAWLCLLLVIIALLPAIHRRALVR